MSKITTPAITRRRLLFAGAGTAGAVAVAAVVAPVAHEAAAPVAEKRDAPDQGGGYQVTQHVLRYYDTARV